MTKDFALSLFNGTERITWEGMRYFTEIFNRVLQKKIESLAPPDPENKKTLFINQYINVCFQCLWSVLENCCSPLYLLFSADDSHALFGSGAWKNT